MGSPETIGITGTYDYRLVTLSVLLAMGASYAALDLAGRVTATRRWTRWFWLVGGAAAMGMGIWAMHYIGMLAFTMQMPVWYDLPIVGLSLLAAILASAIALFIVSRKTMGVWQEIVGSVAMGSGIAAMHYIGMAAMRVPARIGYNPKIVTISVVLAVVISFVALKLAFDIRNEKHTSRRKIVSALVMGSAIPLMHYTSMAAARFYPSDQIPDLSYAVTISRLGIAAIGITSVLVLILTIATAFLDRLLDAQKETLNVSRESEAHFRTLAEAIPQMIWTALPSGETDYMNNRWYEYTGLDPTPANLRNWGSTLHPEDLALCVQKWEQSVQTGETFEIEYRMRRGADGSYRWHLVRAVPIRDSKGSVVKWFGTATDIDDQKHNQETLEDQIRERTGEVVAANAQLHREMLEREQAQDELNHQNMIMVAELTKRSARGVLLAKMGKLLQSSCNMGEAISIVVGLAPKIFPEFRGSLILLNASHSLLEVAGTWANCELPNAPSFDVDSCWALRTGQRHFVEADDQTARCGHASGTKNSYLCIPIMAQGGAAGILHLQSMASTKEPFESELLITGSFAEQVGLSISNLRLQEALRQQSTRDVLTGLFNRRYLEESLEREIKRAARGDQNVAVVMFDLDHFKTFNDTFGHEAGDKVLRELGAFLSKNLRAEDIPCRFGGEEFVLILPGANCQGAASRAERLRSGVKELNVTHQGRSVGVISISIGVAAFPAHGLSVTELIATADGALYKAKREGRDRVVVAEMPDGAIAAAGAAGSG
jgi:diguanylate cyclase (GGDEF)-like protein/PAS domain S-box-containing protein